MSTEQQEKSRDTTGDTPTSIDTLDTARLRAATEAEVSHVTHHLNEMRSMAEALERGLTAKRDAIEPQLAAMEPALESARAALDDLHMADIAELKALRRPPVTLANVLEGVLTLLGVPDTSWASSRTLLSDRTFIQRLFHFDAEAVNAETVAATQQILQAKEDSFKPEVACRTSKATAAFALWTRTELEYCELLLRLRPAIDEARQDQRRLEGVFKGINLCEQELKTLQETNDRAGGAKA